VTPYTIGYEGLTLAQFLDFLRAHGIEHLVDVREAPISRKPGFAKTALSGAVEAAGIRYSHVRALGCPKPIRDHHKETGDWARYTRDFKNHLAGQGGAVAELRAAAGAAHTCLLCYEADFSHCHRAFVAEAVGSAGDEIRHISVKRPALPAEFTSS
jgi:uncharacterized protein (DUF488 family)